MTDFQKNIEDPTDEEMVLARAAAKKYREKWGQLCELDYFRGQNDFWYLMDNTAQARSDESLPANRVVAVWGCSKPDALVGNRNWMKRFPLPENDSRKFDRGHLVAFAAGGGENINLVPQAIRLNRGRGDQGRKWRALELLCTKNHGTFLFVRIDYESLSDIPSGFDYQLSTPSGVKEHCYFHNTEDG